MRETTKLIFWGKRPSGARGFGNHRDIWHCFKFFNGEHRNHHHWKPGSYYSLCRGAWGTEHNKQQQDETPPRTECCADCWRIAKKLNYR